MKMILQDLFILKFVQHIISYNQSFLQSKFDFSINYFSIKSVILLLSFIYQYYLCFFLFRIKNKINKNNKTIILVTITVFTIPNLKCSFLSKLRILSVLIFLLVLVLRLSSTLWPWTNNLWLLTHNGVQVTNVI